MTRRVRPHANRPVHVPAVLMAIGLAMAAAATAPGKELSVDDFTFEGALGSQGARVEKIAADHFKVTLGHAPRHENWANMLQFRILRNAKGRSVRLDVCFLGGNQYRFNDYFYSWSYDGRSWQPIRWQKHAKDGRKGDTLLLGPFTEDAVHVGHQVPMSYEDVVRLVQRYARHPHVKVHVLGKSLGGRNLYRLEITDPQSPHPRSRRWVHYIANQHPGEHNAQWRMVGMIDWLLSEAGDDCRRRSITHFVLMMSPDAPSHGWYRVNAQGVDMNRSYFVGGADAKKQAHEACICQRDLERLMAGDAPVTDVWSMHTWQGIVEPILSPPGPEMGTALPPWTRLRDIIRKHDTARLIKPLKARTKPGNPTYWTWGPAGQFHITTVLCEGAGSIRTRQKNLQSGAVLMRSLAQYYTGLRPSKAASQPASPQPGATPEPPPAAPASRAKGTDMKIQCKIYPHLMALGDATQPKLAWAAQTPAEHRAWAAKARAKVRRLAGRMPDKVPLQVKWAEKKQTKRFTRHKIYVRSEADYWVPAYYFVPKAVRPKTPAIVCLHGHSGVMPYIREGSAEEKAKGSDHDLDYACYLAENGYVTIAAVVRGWNETRHKPPHSCHRMTLSLFLVGMTPMGLRCWDASRLIDFLRTQEVVDGSKIGVAGLSGGGMLACFLPALDDRVKLAMIGGYFCTFRDSIYAIHHCICNCVPHIMEWLEMSDVVASYAPRPVLIIAGKDDSIFPIAATRKAYGKLRRAYKLLGATDKLEKDFFDGPHAWHHAKTLPFLHKHFGPPPGRVEK